MDGKTTTDYTFDGMSDVDLCILRYKLRQANIDTRERAMLVAVDAELRRRDVPFTSPVAPVRDVTETLG